VKQTPPKLFGIEVFGTKHKLRATKVSLLFDKKYKGYKWKSDLHAFIYIISLWWLMLFPQNFIFLELIDAKWLKLKVEGRTKKLG